MIIQQVSAKLRSFAESDSLSLDTAKILLAVSGGVDSMVMLDVFLTLRPALGFKLGLAHMDHGLRTESSLDSDFCRQAAADNGLSCHIIRETPNVAGESIEAWARGKRYAFLKSMALDYAYDWIMTAHHQDDQVETVFMRIRDNSHWSTLIGIRESLGRIRRPMLEISRREILQYAQDHKVAWREDRSNDDTRFLRNEVRHNLLPRALAEDAELRQKILAASASAARKMRGLKHKLESFRSDIVVKVDEIAGELVLRKTEYQKLSVDEKKIFLQSLALKINNDDYITATAGHWESLWQYIDTTDTGTVFELTDQISCASSRNYLTLFNARKFGKAKKKKIPEQGTTWFDGSLKIVAGQLKDRSTNKNSLIISETFFRDGLFIRVWKNGDKIISYSLQKSVKLSHLFNNHKLSYLDKLKQPVIVDNNDEILWLPGIAHSVRAHDGLNTKGELLNIVWQKIREN